MIPPPNLSRRKLLQSTTLGSIAFSGLLADPTRSAADATDEAPLAQRAPHFPSRAKRVIHLFMNGGPSHVDTFDPKPELNRLDGQPLPDSVRAKLQPTQRNRVGNIFGSPFKFKQHGQSGLPISDLFPLVAQHGCWHLGLGVALLTGAALGRVAWLRPLLAIVALGYGYFALIHLHAWLVQGELSMGHVGPSLWHDLALPAAVFWILRRR